MTDQDEAIRVLRTEVDLAWRRYTGAVDRLRLAEHQQQQQSLQVPEPAGRVAKPEASGRTVQSLLFVLGGLLLGSAAIVFTAVAWANVGVGGRAAILAVVTLLVLAVAPVARSRRLGGTAETFAALGLLLVLLDGYAAWYVNLAGVRALTPGTYAGLVFAATAGIALGYGVATRLAGPRFAALVTMQPAVPLLCTHAGFGPAGWAAVFAGVAIADVGLARAGRPLSPRIVAWALAGLGCGVAALTALTALATVDTVPAAARSAAALLVLAAVPLAVAFTVRVAGLRHVAGGLAAFAVAVAAARVTVVAWPHPAFVLVAAEICALAVVAGLMPASVRPGPRIGVLVATGFLGTAAAVQALVAGVLTAWPAAHPWHVALHATADRTDLRLPAVIVLAAVSVAVSLARWSPRYSKGAGTGTGVTIGVAAALLALAVPASAPLAWWAPGAVDGVVVVALVAALLAGRPAGTGTMAAGYGGLALLLATHAVLAGLARPATTIATLAALLVTATACGVAGRQPAVRVAGWLVAAPGAAGLAFAAARATGLPLHRTGLWVLAAAAVVLAAGTVLSRREARGGETFVLEAGAHATALVAVLLTAGYARYAAAVLVLWGIALGLRALVPGGPTRLRAAAGAGCELAAYWLLLDVAGVGLLEAYTLPAAGVALFVGWLAARTREGLHSWTAFGPALIAGFGPSLALALGGTGEPWRRLAVGVAALAVVVLGSVYRRQAPVVVGGLALVGLALHEIALVWDLVPRWIPLAAGGLVLVGLAMTYERRRREVTRIRAAVGRMS